MDEPFGALDAITRMKLQDDIRAIQKENRKTIIFVTHDNEEAVYLSDRVVVMTPKSRKGEKRHQSRSRAFPGSRRWKLHP